jgi:hypothetical protein
MRKKVVHIALIMTVVLASPLLLQTIHYLSDHHDDGVMFPSRELSVSNPEHCLLCDFEYTKMIFTHDVVFVKIPLQFVELVEAFEPSIIEIDKSNLPSLRAPPFMLS